jgi:hypothetical protein
LEPPATASVITQLLFTAWEIRGIPVVPADRIPLNTLTEITSVVPEGMVTIAGVYEPLKLLLPTGNNTAGPALATVIFNVPPAMLSFVATYPLADAALMIPAGAMVRS